MIDEILSVNAYGKTVLLADDATKYYLDPNQKWLPHTVDNICRFKPGQILSIKDGWLSRTLNVSAVIVAKTRTMKFTRRGNPVPQIEIVGLPLQWWAAAHFSE